jgi:hypothetical protein
MSKAQTDTNIISLTPYCGWPRGDSTIYIQARSLNPAIRTIHPVHQTNTLISGTLLHFDVLGILEVLTMIISKPQQTVFATLTIVECRNGFGGYLFDTISIIHVVSLWRDHGPFTIGFCSRRTSLKRDGERTYR